MTIFVSHMAFCGCIVFHRKPISQLQSSSPAIRDHSVTSHSTQVNVFHINPSLAGKSLVSLPAPEEWKTELVFGYVMR